jgi:hypothetical protein
MSNVELQLKLCITYLVNSWLLANQPAPRAACMAEGSFPEINNATFLWRMRGGSYFWRQQRHDEVSSPVL